jgi:hypothetical protein
VSVGAAFGRLGRAIGIVLIFSIVGPLAFATLILLIVAGLGAPLLQISLAFFNLDALSTVVAVALWLLVMATLLASFPPSAAAGCIFASVAVYAGVNAFWMAWLAVALAIIGVIVLGLFIIPDESSAMILPSARSAAQSLSLFAVLVVLAILPTTLCWWLAKPLYRANIAA